MVEVEKKYFCDICNNELFDFNEDKQMVIYYNTFFYPSFRVYHLCSRDMKELKQFVKQLQKKENDKK